MSENHSTSANLGKTATQLPQIFATLVLTSILSLSGSLTLLQAANAAPTQLAQSAASEILKDKQGDNRLPPRLANAVRQDLSRRVGIAPGKLKITEFSRKTWLNGCLGLSLPGEFCAEALVPGWRIVLSDGTQTWFYRTDTQGQVLRLEDRSASNLPKDEKASEIGSTGTLKPAKISQNELPPPLSEGAIFRAIASGGITGQTYETTLTNDGRVLRALVNPNNAKASVTEIRQISPQQIQQFQQLLESQKFSCFNQLSYQVPEGAADLITITLTSPGGTTKYVEIVQGSLPKALQEVIQGWNQIAKG